MLTKKKKELLDYESMIVERGKSEGLIRRDIETIDIVNSLDGMIEVTIRHVCFIEAENTKLDVKCRVKSIMKIFLEGISGQVHS